MDEDRTTAWKGLAGVFNIENLEDDRRGFDVRVTGWNIS
jgi:hypothetical protein